jgi:hypothetical protein
VFDENDDLAVGSVTKRNKRRPTLMKIALYIKYFKKQKNKKPNAKKLGARSHIKFPPSHLIYISS